MERAKYIIPAFITFFSIESLFASYNNEIYKAYISNDMYKWKQIIDQMNSGKNKSNAFILELVNYQYGYIAWCIGNDKKSEARKYLDSAEKNIEILENANYKPSVINAYKAAFYGYRMGLNRLKAATLGPKSLQCIETALELDKSNWFAYVQYANMKYYSPAVFGGSKTEAIRNYKTAKALLEKEGEHYSNNWNYLNLLVIIAQSYDETAKGDVAVLYYQKILRIEPDFLWVKNELYPDLMKRMNEK